MTEKSLIHTYFSVEIDDEPLSIEDIARVDNVKIVDHKEDMDQASFDIGDPEYEYQTLFIPGRRIKIVLGYLDGDTYTFVGEIAGIKVVFGADGIPVIKVKCDNNAKKMTEKQEQKQWENMKRSDMVKELAGKYGLDAYVADTIKKVEFETQAGITDAAFVVRLAAKENYLFKVRGNALYFGPEGGTRTSKRRLQYRVGKHSIASADLGFKTEDEARNVSGSQVNEREASTTEVNYREPDAMGDCVIDELAQQEGEGATDDDGVNFNEFERESIAYGG